MKKNYKKIIIGVAAIAVIVLGMNMFSEKKVHPSDIKVFTSISDSRSTTVYSNDVAKNSLFFLVAINGSTLKDMEIEFEFDKEVNYEMAFTSIKDRNSLPIEYYLAAETEFDFAYMDEFNKYVSDRKAKKEYEENADYEDYLDGYKADSFYKEYMSGYNFYMVEVDILNSVEETKLQKMTFVKYEEENDEKVRHDVLTVETDVKFVNVALNSNNMYTVNSEPYSLARYYDQKAKYNLQLTCNKDAYFSDFSVEGYELVNVSSSKESFSCSAGQTINFEVEFNIKTNNYFTDSIIIKMNVNGESRNIYTPQIFAPSNFMLVMEEDMSKYSRYFQYKYSK